MINKIQLEDYYVFLNPHAKTLIEEYEIAHENKMWATIIILSLTIIDNILSDENCLEHIDGLDLNELKKSRDMHWLRSRRNKILHYEGPAEGFYGSKDSLRVLKLDADRANKVINECFSKLFNKNLY
jgi:hypothetical protein